MRIKMETRVLNILQSNFDFRERRKRDIGLLEMLANDFPFLTDEEHHMVGRELLLVIKRYNTMVRTWNRCLEKMPHLRGKDYADKVGLEKAMKEELGYNRYADDTFPHQQTEQIENFTV